MPTQSTKQLHVFVATPLSDEHARLIESLEPRVKLILDHDLLPPVRWPSDHTGDPAFKRSPQQQARFEELRNRADALYGVPDESPAQLADAVAANPRLRWVQTMAAGGGATVRAAGLSEADLARVAFTTAAGVHAPRLAEFALLGALAGLKDVARLQRLMAARTWAERWVMGTLQGCSVLIVGLGHIGRETARVFSLLGADVVAVNRSPRQAAGVRATYPVEWLPDVIGQADIIVCALPQAVGTDQLVSAAALARMQPGAIFVNVGRGTSVDEAALIEALQDGRIGYAALDVVRVEPLPADSPLWTFDNVLISPHTAATSDTEDRQIAELFADNATRLLDGRELRNVVDPVLFY